MAIPALEDLTGCTATSAVSLMGTTKVVELQVAMQGDLHLVGSGEEAPVELDSPGLLQDGAVQSLDEAVGPGMARLGSGVVDTPFAAGLVEPTAELVVLIGQDPMDPPARAAEGWYHSGGQEPSGGLGRELQAVLGDAVGASRSRAVYCQTLPTPLSLPM
jgi:hypothetical protein